MKPGLFPNIPMADYVADKLCVVPTLNASSAHTLLSQSPFHAFTAHPRLNPAAQQDESNVADIGTVAHEVLLTGSTSRIVVVQAEDWRTKAAQEARKAARENGGVAILVAKMADVKAMVDAAQEYVARS